MKILVEIPNKSIDMAKVVLMSGCETEEQENEICEACERLKTHADPIELDFGNVEDQELKSQIKQMYVALAIIVVGAVQLKDLNTEKEK